MSVDARASIARNVANAPAATASIPRERGASTARNIPAVASTSRIDLTTVRATAPTLQRKPTISMPGDSFEREADEVADKVMRMAEPASIGARPPAIQRKCAACEDEDKKPIQTKRTTFTSADVTLDTGAAARATERGGVCLSKEVRSYFEPRFGHDFSQVRVHADSEAARAACAMQARAYTFGSDIVFGVGEYAPATAQGRRLLAHELVHVVQQGASSVASPRHAPDRRPMPLSQSQSGIVQRAPQQAGSVAHRGSTLPYREAKNLTECTQIMGSENLEYCRREVLGDDSPDAPLAVRAERVSQDLTDLIAGATWKEIRKRVYPKESAPGVRRAKERKAGRLPDLTGLGRISSLEHFAGAVRGVQRDWTTLNADGRKNKLGDAAKAEMVAADVPGFLVVDKQPMEFKGFFRRHDWSFTISEALVTSVSLGDDDAAELANTALHESRHAEEQFLAARFSAGNGKDATGIHNDQIIPTTIAQQAVDRKFDATTDPKVAALGRAMFDATVTQGTANQRISNDDGLAELAVRKTEAETALSNLRSSVTSQTFSNAVGKRSALRAQIIDVERRYTLYRNIPYEADAHEVGDAAEQAFKGWK